MFKWQACVILFLVTTVVYIVGSIAASNTFANGPPLWTRDCQVARQEAGVVLTCGDYEEVIGKVPSLLYDALATTKLTTRCVATNTRGVLKRVELSCEHVK